MGIIDESKDVILLISFTGLGRGRDSLQEGTERNSDMSAWPRPPYVKEKAYLVEIRLRDPIHFEWRRRGVIHGRIRSQVLNEILIPDQCEICA
jgi:hypothetical protein